MKKILLIICLLLLTSCGKEKTKTDIKIDDNYVYISQDVNCKEKEYYKRNDRNIYLLCLNDVYINKKSLKDYLEDSSLSLEDNIDKITSSMNNKNSLFDGGTKVYKDELTIVRCNTIDGNRDIFISYKDVDINNICKRQVKNKVASTTAVYIYDLKDDLDLLTKSLDLQKYGHYNFVIKDKSLNITYTEVEGWGNILDKKDILLEKSSILLSLIKDVNKIVWIANKNTKTISTDDLNIKYIKDYGETTESFNELLSKLNYSYNPISFNTKEMNKKSIKLEIINNSDITFNYGEYFILQKYVDNKWIIINSEQAFNALGYTLKGKERRELSQIFINNLDNGTYRIVKDFDEIINETKDGFDFGKKYYILKEFEIN